MQNTSTTYQTLLAGTHRKEVRLIINDNLIFGEGEIFSMSVDGALFGANTLSFGGCVSREIRVKFLPGSAAIPRMAKLQPQVRLTNGTTTSEWIPKGTFYIDTREYDRETGTLTLTGYDAMLKAEATYIAEGYVGTWPRPMDDVATEICGLLGLTMDSRTDLEEWDVQLPTGYSMREVLGGIAAAHAGNWIITDEGKLRLIRAADMISSAVSVVGRNASTYKDDEAFQPITHVTVDVGGEFVVESAAATDNGRLLRVSCPWGTQAIADDILSSLNGFVYQPYEASGALLDPAVEIGDRVTINGINGLLAVQTLTFNSLCLSDMSAPGEDEIDHEYPYEAVGTREVKRKLSGIEATLYIGPDSIVAKVEDLEEGAIDSVVVEYAVGTSSTTAPTTGWSTSSPQWQEGKYIWQRTVTTYADSTVENPHVVTSSPVCIQGAMGEDGVGISQIVPEYYLSTSASTPTGGSWSTTPPAWQSGRYIWTRSHIYWDNNTNTTTTPVLDNATNGLGQKYSELKQTVDGFELTVTNGSTTSTIKLMSGSTVISSQTISFSGLVSFAALGSPQSQTFIDGANIKTGTISADMINVNDLKVKTIWNYDGDMLIQTSAAEKGVLTIGYTRDSWAEADNSTAAYREISVYASRFRFLSPYVTNKFNLCIDFQHGEIFPYSLTSAFGAWSIGNSYNPFDVVYAMRYYLGYEDYWGDFHFGYLNMLPGGGLDYVDENGTAHAIV